MIDGIIIAAAIIIWDITRDCIIVPRRVDKKVGTRIEKLETKMDKILKKMELH